MIKYLNLIVLFILLACGIFLKDSLHFSTNLLSLFTTQGTLSKFKIADNLGYSKEMLIAVKGFDATAQKRTKELTQQLEKLHHIDYVQSSVVPTEAMQEYYKKYYPLLADFNSTKMTQAQSIEKLQNLYDEQLSGFFYTTINKSDPLNLFHLRHIKQSGVTHRGEFITLGKYGYLIRVMTDVSPSQMQEAKELYDAVHKLLSNYSDVVAFAPFFYTVENSQKIKADVQWIVVLSTIVLLFIYYLLIKNLRLLTETLIALVSSMLFATLLCTLFIENFNLLSLAFGMSLTAVSIDYLLHYHFHNFYQSDKKVDKNVLYGYLTTVVAFAIFAFIPIPLIAQISTFAVLSLSFAFVLFTFVFPKLELTSYVPKEEIKEQKQKRGISSITFFFISLALLIYSASYFVLDSDIKKLDYQNSNLHHAQQLFQTNSGTTLHPVIVKASSQERLFSELHQLKKVATDSFSLANFVQDKESCQRKKEELNTYDFQRLKNILNQEAVQIGFKKNYFSNAYSFTKNLPSCEMKNSNIFQSYGLSIYQAKGIFYTIALVNDVNVTKRLPYVIDLDIKKIFQKSAYSMVENLMLYGSIVIGLIAILLFFSVKKNFIYALNYILFPLGVTLSVLVSLGGVNIMHLFSLIILVAIGIDYGIYMSNSKKVSHTMLAIKYSLLSTFAAFGVLIFSTITALHSIGVVITLGCGAIFLLIKVMR